MAYITGDLILDDHYNDFADPVNAVWYGGKNLAWNGGLVNYEGTLPQGWGSYNNGAISVTHSSIGNVGPNGLPAHRYTANANTTCTLGIYCRAGSTDGGIYSWSPGTTYTISFWARAAGATAAGHQMYGCYSNMGFTSIVEASNPPLINGTWQRYIFQGVPNNNAHTPFGELYISWKTAGTLLAGASIDLAGVQVEVGATATDFNHYQSGYGQGSTIADVAAGQTISAAQWATMLARINSAAAHQGTSLTAITSPTAGNTISAYSALSGNITAINSNRFRAAASGADITAGGVGQRTAAWAHWIVMDYTINFASAAAAKYFFNAGGHIRISTARWGGTAHSKNTEWSNLCAQVGTIVICNGFGTVATGVSYGNPTIAGVAYNTGFTKIGGSGTANIVMVALGYYSATATETVGFRQYEDNAPYGANYIRVTLQKNSATQLVVRVGFFDDSADNSIPSSLDVVDGTLQTTMVLRPPSTTYISNSWGTPTMSVAVSGG